MNRLAAIIAAALIVLGAGPAWADQGDDNLAFARHLARTGQAEQAAVEYQRFLFLSPDHPAVDQARLEAADVYLRLGRTDLVDAVVTPLIGGPPSELSGRALVKRALAFKASGRAAQARRLLTELNRRTDYGPRVTDLAAFELGWLETAQGQWAAAAQAFGLVSPQGRLGARAAWLAERVAEGDLLDQRSPSLAGWLSLIPGLGQAYLGRWPDAAWSAGLSLVPAAGAVLAFAAANTVTGGLLAVVAAVFYGGNFYSAVSEAHRLNQKIKRDFIRRLKLGQQKVPLGAG